MPQQQLADGQVDFAIAWVPKALATREAGADIVNIAQIFQRSGTLQVSFADAGITTPADFAGKNIGNWGFGNEYEVFAALGEAGLDPATDVNLVGQDFNMNGLLSGDIDAAEAMTYNEYAQVLEAVNPETGELYTPEDFNVISYEEVGVGMLQDAIWADGAKLADDPAYKDIATRFVAASIQGWAYCRDEPESCRDIVVAAGSQLGDSHQLWQMNEVNKLIWPAVGGIGMMDEEAWDRTVEIAQNTPNLEGATVLTAPPDRGRLHHRDRRGGDRAARRQRRHRRRRLRADRGHARGGRRLDRGPATSGIGSVADPGGPPWAARTRGLPSPGSSARGGARATSVARNTRVGQPRRRRGPGARRR